jgi:nitroreductase
MDVGHAAQNLCLQATALGLGAVVIGAFDDREVKRVAGLRLRQEPLVLLPVGHLA